MFECYEYYILMSNSVIFFDRTTTALGSDPQDPHQLMVFNIFKNITY